MKIIFLSSSKIALFVLYALMKNHKILAVITQPDRPQGRNGHPIPTPIAEAALEKNIPVFKPVTIESDLIDELKKLDADLFITFAYGLILKKEFLNITKLGGINIHPSLLPILRGPSPIKTSILNGFTKSGITIQKVAYKVDAGDILLQNEFDIKADDDAISLEGKIAEISAEIINPLLARFENNDIIPAPQDDKKATYCRIIRKNDGYIDWAQSGVNIINKIRAFVDWPIAYTFFENKRINIYKASFNSILRFEEYAYAQCGEVVEADKHNGIVLKTGDCLININSLQLAGKKILNWNEFLNGHHDLKNKIWRDSQ